jgi:hypothetical protein|nr:MAG TPA: hypothetical protein [Caudoviricetes sp.]
MAIVNMTGNPCHIVDEYGDRIATIEPGPTKFKPYYAAGAVEAVDSIEVDGKEIDLFPSDFDKEAHDGYRIDRQLPDYDFDNLVLVPTWAISALVREGMDDRDDIVVAHRVVRDSNGKVLGCRGLRFVFPEYDPDLYDFDCDACGCGCGC